MFESFSAPSFEKVDRSQAERTRRISFALGEHLLRSPLGFSLRTLVLPAMLSAGCASMRMGTRSVETIAATTQATHHTSPEEIEERRFVHEQTQLDFDILPFEDESSVDQAHLFQTERESLARTRFEGFEAIGLDGLDLQQHAVASLPRSWTSAGNVQTVTFQNRDRRSDQYGEILANADVLAECTTSMADRASEIRIFRRSFFGDEQPLGIDGQHPDMERVEQAITTTLYHEFMHSRDWFSSSYLTREQRVHLLTRTLQRVEAADCFSSSYVTSINNNNRQQQNLSKATEYLAVIAETVFSFDDVAYRRRSGLPDTMPTRDVLIQYIAERGGINVASAAKDLSLIEEAVHYTDPEFDIIESLPRRQASRIQLLTNTYRRQIARREQAIQAAVRPEVRRVWDSLAPTLRTAEFSTLSHSMMRLPAYRNDQPEGDQLLRVFTRLNDQIENHIEVTFPTWQEAVDVNFVRTVLATPPPEQDIVPTSMASELDLLRAQYHHLNEQAEALSRIETHVHEPTNFVARLSTIGAVYQETHLLPAERSTIRHIFLSNHLTPPL